MLIVPNSNSKIILWFFRSLLLKIKTKHLGYMYEGLLISPWVDFINTTLNLSLTDMTSKKPLTEPGLLLNHRLYHWYFWKTKYSIMYRKSSTVKYITSMNICLCNHHFLFTFFLFPFTLFLFLLSLICKVLGKFIHHYKPQRNIIHMQKIIVKSKIILWSTMSDTL